MRKPIRLHVDAHSPIPIRWQLAEQLKHVIEGGGVPRDQALPSIRELAGFLGINPNTVARSIEDLKRSGHVESRRGKGVFMAVAPRLLSGHRRPPLLADMRASLPRALFFSATSLTAPVARRFMPSALASTDAITPTCGCSRSRWR